MVPPSKRAADARAVSDADAAAVAYERLLADFMSATGRKAWGELGDLAPRLVPIMDAADPAILNCVGCMASAYAKNHSRLTEGLVLLREAERRSDLGSLLHLKARTNIHATLCYLGSWRRAIAEVDAVLADLPHYPDASADVRYRTLYWKARAYSGMNDLVRASDLYQQVAASAPEELLRQLATIALASVTAWLGDWQAADALLFGLVPTEDQWGVRGHYLGIRAQICHLMGDHDLALRFGRSALPLIANREGAGPEWYSLGRLLRTLAQASAAQGRMVESEAFRSRARTLECRFTMNVQPESEVISSC